VITHPFLPTAGREIEVIGRATHWSEQRVMYLDEEGRAVSVSLAFTDLAPVDEFIQVAAGRCAFRTQDLLELGRRLDVLFGPAAAP
jgi:hypothetical protein